SANRGITTTTRFRPPPSTGCAGGRSTSPDSSSRASSGSGSLGTSSGSAPSGRHAGSRALEDRLRHPSRLDRVRRVVILGSTGSIGTQALDVVERSDELEVVALAAATRLEALVAPAQ